MQTREIEDIKTFLNQAFIVDCRIEDKKVELAKLEEIKNNITYVDVAKISVPIQQENTLKLNNIIASYSELLISQLTELIEIKKAIVHLISNVTDEEYKCLLELRYIYLYKWDDIAIQMTYSKGHVHRIHKKALNYLINNNTIIKK